jgi:hypothetical protein
LSRSASIEKGPRRKFATVLREDGYWVNTLLSKNMKAARQKAVDWVSGSHERPWVFEVEERI